MLLGNRYKIIQTLGSGGFGETFLAEDTQIPSHRRCVIKQLKPIEDNPEVYQLVQQRFKREAAILEELGDGSDQIPRLYAYFSIEGQFYLVQEYIEGQTLNTELQKQKLMGESRVNEILTSMLTVLEYVHDQGIVHRDIKPENILIRYSDGKPILIDFGAVKETIGTVMTTSGNSDRSIVIGTPGFMPSEQSVGRPMFASDIYSLGLTGIYLLTGKTPQELPTDPATGMFLWREYAPNITSSFANVLDKATQFQACQRFHSAREMLQALYKVVSPVPPTVSHPKAGDIPHYNQTLVASARSSQFLHQPVSVSQSALSGSGSNSLQSVSQNHSTKPQSTKSRFLKSSKVNFSFSVGLLIFAGTTFLVAGLISEFTAINLSGWETVTIVAISIAVWTAIWIVVWKILINQNA
jgi:serine/threonine-protein kinase